ncbi:MAG: hypothetical protein ACJ72E_15010 [Marmoricola sp.]
MSRVRGLAGLAALLVAALSLGGCGAHHSSPRTAPPTTPASPTATDGNGALVPTDLPSHLPGAAPSSPATKTPQEPVGTQVLGADASWPQCPKGMGIAQKRSKGAPMPTADARFVVLGLTNGPSFVANPCLGDQVAWVAGRHLYGAAYSIVSYPDAATLSRYGRSGPFGSAKLDRLRNTGYAAARFNVATMKATGLRTPVVWVDVEPVPDFEWSKDTAANAAVVQGAARGYSDAGFTVGYYSTPSLWERVVGYLPTGSPEWRAAGETSQAEALSRCGTDWSFSGGPGVLAQWVQDGRDVDVTCPGMRGSFARWFHQY